MRNKTANSPRFSTKNGGNDRNLSAKMDSRFRGNDSGKAGIRRARIGRRREAEFHKKTAKFRKKSPAIPAENKKNPPSFPPKTRKIPRHSRESGNPLWAINFGIPARFFRKKRRERGDLSAKMDSRFRGNDGGEAGICRRESDGGGRFRFTSEWKKLEIRKKEFTIPANAGISAGDSDLHRNGKK